jgi:hypothetical protein
MKDKWFGVVILGLAMLFGYFLAGNGIFSRAEAQVSEGQAGGIICVVGGQNRNYLPIVLVDTREQRLLVYEFYGQGNLYLRAARPYMYDRMMPPYKNGGLTVADVRRQIEQ